jgi:uncharacterized spore protein YtfJ
MTTTATSTSTTATVFDRIDGLRDAASVRRVFGEVVHHDGALVIPVAAIRGAGGGGAGAGPEAGERAGSGGGLGFSFRARPVGVFVVRGDRVIWKPAVDLVRALLAGQVALVGLIVAVFVRRRRLDRMGCVR